jgi:hypothetical protein
MVASLPLEGVDTYMLLLFESGQSHPGIGTKVVQSYLYTVCIQYTVYICTVYCLLYTVYRVQYTGCIYDTGYSYNL